METPNNWGNWIKRRAFLMGYETQKALSEAVDVSPQVVSSWFSSDFPPRLRKSSVNRLADVLETHHGVITSDWYKTAPEDAPRVEDYDEGIFIDQALAEMIRLAKEAGYVELAGNLSESMIRKKIDHYLELLHGNDLVEICRLCARLHDKSMSDFEQKMKEMGDIFTDTVMADAQRWQEILEQQQRAVNLKIETNLRGKAKATSDDESDDKN